MTRKTFDNLYGMAIGFDEILGRLAVIEASQNSYPPYNVIKRSESCYTIEIACAGFTMEDIKIVLDKGVLTVHAQSSQPDDNLEYVWRGLSSRSWRQKFHLNSDIQVGDASMSNGMLIIWLDRVVPESAKPKIIPIRDSNPQFLVEKDNS